MLASPNIPPTLSSRLILHDNQLLPYPLPELDGLVGTITLSRYNKNWKIKAKYKVKEKYKK